MQRNFLILIAVIGILGLSLGSFTFVSAATFNNVVVNVQTSSMQADYFIVNAFNMTGYLEASVQTHYSVASFELPSGQYIFTATANNQSYSAYDPVPPLATSGGAASSSISPSLPVYVAPAVEYGFSVQQISSSTSITITTQNVIQYPTNSLAVKVLYPNGTAAAGASVSASVFGSSYYWGYEANVVTWATTAANGIATLTTPTAPVQINAWLWIQSNETSSPTVMVGAPSQVVNGSVIAIPTYVGLAGSALVVPSQSSVTITLQVQQPNYWVTPYVGASTAVPSSSSLEAGPGSLPSSVYTQQQGSPNLQNFRSPSTTSTPQSTPSQITLTGGSTPTPINSGNMFGGSLFAISVLIVVAIVTVVVVGLTLIFKGKRKNL